MTSVKSIGITNSTGEQNSVNDQAHPQRTLSRLLKFQRFERLVIRPASLTILRREIVGMLHNIRTNCTRAAGRCKDTQVFGSVRVVSAAPQWRMERAFSKLLIEAS